MANSAFSAEWLPERHWWSSSLMSPAFSDINASLVLASDHYTSSFGGKGAPLRVFVEFPLLVAR